MSVSPREKFEPGQQLMVLVDEDTGVQPATVLSDHRGPVLQVRLKDNRVCLVQRSNIRDVRPPQEALDAAVDTHLRMLAGRVRQALREAEHALSDLQGLRDLRKRWDTHPYTADTEPIRLQAYQASEKLSQIGRQL